MIKKEYIQPEVKEIEIKLPAVLATLSGEKNVPDVDTDDLGFDDEDDI